MNLAKASWIALLNFSYLEVGPTQRNDRRRRHSRASTPKWEIEDSGFKPVVPSRPSATARPNGSKEGLGTLGRRDRAAHELGQVRKPGTSDRKLEKDAEGRGTSRGGRAVFTVVKKAARPLHARLP
jgi:hypothetical protein